MRERGREEGIGGYGRQRVEGREGNEGCEEGGNGVGKER